MRRVNLYRRPGGKIKSFLNSIERAHQNVDLAKKDVIILDVFNIDFMGRSNVNIKCVWFD